MSHYEASKKHISDELERKGYSSRTIETYLFWVRQLCKYFPDTAVEDFTFEQLEEFIEYQTTRKKAAARTVHQAAHSIGSVQNEVYGKDFDATTLDLPQRKTKIPDVITQDELIRFLNSSEGTYRIIFATMYSAGLTLEELRNLRVKDLKLDHRQLSVYQKQGISSRKAVVAEYLVKEFQSYLKEHHPQKWLFEGKRQGTQISSSAIQRAFKRALLKSNIRKDITPRTLKYAYVKHLNAEGIPLKSILRTLGMSVKYQSRTYKFYGDFCYEDVDIQNSPLDRIIYGNDLEIDTRSIERLLITVHNEEERDYLTEALECIRAKLYRASVIFTWTAAIRNIQNKCLTHSPNSLNIAIQKYYPKAPKVKNVENFAYIKDSVVIEASKELGIFDKAKRTF